MEWNTAAPFGTPSLFHFRVHSGGKDRDLGFLHFLRSDPRSPGLHSSDCKAQPVSPPVSEHEFQTSVLSVDLQISCSFLSSPAWVHTLETKKFRGADLSQEQVFVEGGELFLVSFDVL